MHQHDEFNTSDEGKFVVGVISNTDPTNGLVKVMFAADTDDDDDDNPGTFETDWIPFIVRKSQNCKETFPFDIGEQVICLMDENWEEGTVLGCTYNDEDKPDGAGNDIYRIKYKDGSYEQFNRSTGNKEAYYTGDWKQTNHDGADFESSGAKIKLGNGTGSAKSILTNIVNKILASNYTNGAGVTGPPNNAPDFTAILTDIDNLFA